MCIQSVGEKKCTQCNLSGPAIIINDGNFWRNHAKLLQQQVFRLFLATTLVKIPHLAFIDENLNGISDHLSDPYYCPPPNYLKNGFCWRRKPRLCLHYIVQIQQASSCMQLQATIQRPNVDHAKVYHLVAVSAFFALRLGASVAA